MSLNKFTDINQYKQWCNINCNAIECKTLSVNGNPIDPTSAKSYGSFEMVDNAQATQALVASTVTAIDAGTMVAGTLVNFEVITSHFDGKALRYTGTDPIVVKVDTNVSWQSNEVLEGDGSVGLAQWTFNGNPKGSNNLQRDYLIGTSGNPNYRQTQTSSTFITTMLTQEYIQPVVRLTKSGGGGGTVEYASVQFTITEL